MPSYIAYFYSWRQTKLMPYSSPRAWICSSSSELQDISKNWRWFNFCKISLMSFLVRLTPTRHRTFSLREKAVMVATWLAVNPTLFSDNIRFFICIKTAVQQQAFILWQSLRVKVSRGKDSVNRKLRDDIGCPLKSKYLRRLENPSLFSSNVSSLLSVVLISIYLMEKHLNPLECDMLLIKFSSLKYLMCHSSRRKQLHRMLLSFTICLHLLEIRHNVLRISFKAEVFKHLDQYFIRQSCVQNEINTSQSYLEFSGLIVSFEFPLS